MTRYRITIFLIVVGIFLSGVAPVLPTVAWGLEVISTEQQEVLRGWIWPSLGIYAAVWAVYITAIVLYDHMNGLDS